MSEVELEGTSTRYEFRVWGKRKDVCKRLTKLADAVSEEQVHDCYLLGPDHSFNAKIRRNRLKVKTLVGERSGFERWSSTWHPMSAKKAPKPFNLLLAELDAKNPPKQGFERKVAKTIDKLDLDQDLRAVVVDKYRKRFDLGSIRAEATKLRVEGQSGPLRSVAIEGSDIDDLIQLRSLLGLAKVPNLAVHLAVDLQHQ
jgi:hypothetical protein